jgi:anti-anti-sigma regulatory factor
MSNKAALIDCGEYIGIAEVSEMHADILTRLAEGQSIRFDVSKVDRIDCAALQLLYCCSKEMSDNDQQLSWHSPSAAFINSANVLGMLPGMNIEVDD